MSKTSDPSGSATVPVSVPVVAIGASAGGLKALESFFRNMPSESGFAFAVAMHLSREHKSQLAAILETFTSMPVTQVGKPMDVKPNHVYVIAPGRDLSLDANRLKTANRLPVSGVIDDLFRSVAASRKHLGVGIVLSGSGTDGMLGMVAIHERGGFLMAQDPDDAEYASMPLSIIDKGIVDAILPAKEIPARLMKRPDQDIRAVPPRPEGFEDEEVLREILDILLARTGHDFSHYKRSTLLRQISRRMMVMKADDIPTYARMVHEDKEAQALFRNLLITVTRFFRDSKAWAMLERKVLPELFKHASSLEGPDPRGIRAWVPGCATGEEVYSLAMLLSDGHSTSGQRVPIQILATDVDEAALTVARRRRYSAAGVADVSPENLAAHFTKKNGYHVVRDELRSLVVFSSHDLTRDPPFTRIDLLSCRNLLMYFESEMQDKILKRFAYSLRPGGYLFLGTAESVNDASRFFTPVSKALGLYRRTLAASSSPPLDFSPLTRRETFGQMAAPSYLDADENSDTDADMDADMDADSHEEGATFEPSQGELILANQEMQSLNEELRSMMEELEVAKEELQSLNEELITVNQELQNKIEEHRRVNNDLQILIESTHMATLFLDRELNVILFTPESTKIFPLLPVDIGRPLEHISHRLVYSNVLVDARRVLETDMEVTCEVQAQDDTWYAMRALPYRSADGPVEGVVLSFADITSQKKVEQVGDDRFSLAFNAGPMATAIVLRENGRFVDINHIFESITGYSRKEIIGRSSSDLGFHFDEELLSYEQGVSSAGPPNMIETRIRTRQGAIRDLVVSTTAIDFGGQPCYLSLFHDITERKRLEREILLVSDREQRRIGVDLHDGLGAHLSGLSMMARGLARKLHAGRVVEPEEMDEIAQLLSHGIEQARSLAQGLNPFLLEVRGLSIALSDLAKSMEDQTGITCSFEGGEHESALSSEESMHLYRITQEAVTNAVRHGSADKIQIILSKIKDLYRLVIHDDGIGYQPGPTPDRKPAGMGLSIMRYRAEMIGAKLEVIGSPENGTTVSCIFRASAES